MTVSKVGILHQIHLFHGQAKLVPIKNIATTKGAAPFSIKNEFSLSTIIEIQLLTDFFHFAM